MNAYSHNLSCFFIVIAIISSDIVPAIAKPHTSKTSQSAVCNFNAWSSDTDPKGLNVRSAPSSSAPIVGVLPPPESSEESGPDSKFASEFHVAEARNGWFRIENAKRWADTISGSNQKSAPLPSGWISGKKIYVTIFSETGFSAPDAVKSDILWRGDWSDLQSSMTGMIDCKGEWAKVTYLTPKGTKSAWFRGICAIQETTCGAAWDSAAEVDRLRRRR
jgi:hypothetical protein